MKAKLPLLLCILFIAGVVNAQTQIGIGPGNAMWARYTVKGEEFSVALPREPSLKTSEVLLTRTNKNRRERVLQTSANGLDYTIYVYENPKPRQSLEEFISERNAGSALNLATEVSVIAGKFNGKEYSSQDGKTIEQFFATEKRLYRFVVAGATDEPWRVKQFFASITFGKKPESFEVLEGPSPDDEVGKIVSGKEVDRKPRLIEKPEPSYTDKARNAQIEGTVVLKVVFSASGRVTNIRVAAGLPFGLTERSIAAAKQIKFVPAMKDGKNVSMWIQLEYNFRLY